MLKVQVRRRVGIQREALRLSSVNSILTSRMTSEVGIMQWELVVALVVAIPVILFPAAYVWYLNIGGIYAAIKEARAKRVACEEVAKVAVQGK